MLKASNPVASNIYNRFIISSLEKNSNIFHQSGPSVKKLSHRSVAGGFMIKF
jgi:hypothetical protein